MRASQDIITSLQTNAGNSEKAVTGIESLRAVDTADDQRESMQSLRKKVEELYLNSLPASEKKAEKARLEARQKNCNILREVNAKVFGRKTKVGKPVSRLEKTVLRELDYMLYNFSDDDLELYAGYTQHCIQRNNYFFLGARDKYDPDENRVYVKFMSQHPTLATHDYTPRYNWMSRFHEEFHQIDNILGGKCATNAPRKNFTHPQRKGKAFNETLRSETLAFVNTARREAKLPKLDTFPSEDTTVNETLKAVINYIDTHCPTVNEKHGLAHVTDLLGLCSNGIIDKENLFDYIKEHDREKENWTMGNELIHGHPNQYNKKDAEEGDNATAWHATSEALSDLTSSRLCGESNIHSADQLHLHQSRQKSIDLIKEMLDITHSEGFTWQR